MSPLETVEIHWCSASEYGDDSFPHLSVVAPESRDRLERWQSVLEEYAALCVIDRKATCQSQSEVQVLSLSPELALAARNLSRLLGARFIREQADIVPSDPLYVFGTPETMTHRVLNALRDRPGLTSFLPAIDLPAASFIAAKLALASLIGEPRGHLSCDVILGQAADFSALVTSGENNDRAVGEWGTVIIQAHGDGAHANVSNVVLCGRVGQTERLSDGGIIAGCEQRIDGPHCKRKGPRHVGICVLQDLRARHLVLLSCNALTLGDGQYPSTSSLVVAAFEGYASAVVATHVSYVLNPDEIATAETMVRDRRPLASLYMRLRGLRQTLNSLDPFVYAGLIRDDGASRSSQWNQDHAGVDEVDEFGEALAAWQTSLTRVGQRFTEHLSALRLIHLKEPAQAAGQDAEALHALEAHTSRYVSLLHAFLSEAESWRLNRSNHEHALRLLHEAIQAGKACDGVLATNMLARFRNSDYALGEFGKRKSGWKSTGLPCENCGNDLTRIELSSFLFPTLTGHRLACPTCGAFEIALPSAGKLTVSAPTTWRHGDVVPIKAKLRPGGRHGRLWREVGWGTQFGFHITHYGHTPYLSRLVTPEPGEVAIADFECPADMHPDIYSITVVAILGGCLSIRRLRTLCV